MFKDRKEAGILLAEQLKKYKEKRNVVVIGLTRGGVVVSYQVSKELKLLHDILVVKKIGAPYNPELAIGAVAPPASQARALRAGPTVYWDEDLCSRMGISKEIKNAELKIKNQERKEKEKSLKKGKAIDIQKKEIILVDDGVATGATAIVASLYLRKQKAKRIILAVPVASEETFRNIRKYFNNIVVLQIAKDFSAVGQFYQEFPQVEDAEVAAILRD